MWGPGELMRATRPKTMPIAFGPSASGTLVSVCGAPETSATRDESARRISGQRQSCVGKQNRFDGAPPGRGDGR